MDLSALLQLNAPLTVRIDLFSSYHYVSIALLFSLLPLAVDADVFLLFDGIQKQLQQYDNNDACIKYNILWIKLTVFA